MQVQRTRPVTHRKPQRGGFTLIELLVVISIIAVLMSLLLPAIQNAREAARRAQCLSQMRNIAIGLQAHIAATGGRLPYLVTNPGVANSLVVDTDGAAGGGQYGANWAIQLLPYIEQQSLFDRMTLNPNPAAAIAGHPDNPTVLAQTVNIKVYTCPDDPDAESGGTLSFVVNGGFTSSTFWTNNAVASAANLNSVHWAGADGSGVGYDWSFNGYTGATRDDIEVTRATGAFFQELNNSGYRSTIDRFKDGTSHTIVLSENLQATSWNSPVIDEMAFVVPIAGDDFEMASNASTQNGMGPDAATPPLKSEALDYNATGISFGADPFKEARINDDLGTAVEGNRPRPSSLHPNVVNVFFGDGNGRSLSNNIDDTVYLRLVTSGGERFGQNILSDSF